MADISSTTTTTNSSSTINNPTTIATTTATTNHNDITSQTINTINVVTMSQQRNQKYNQEQQKPPLPPPLYQAPSSSKTCKSVGKENYDNSMTANCNKMKSIDSCSDPNGCVSLHNILKSFNAPISEEQAWALIYQSVQLYRDVCRQEHNNKGQLKNINVPTTSHNLNVHKDGSVHVNFKRDGK